MKRKLNRKKSDIQEVIDNLTFVIIWGQVQSEWPWVKVDGLFASTFRPSTLTANDHPVCFPFSHDRQVSFLFTVHFDPLFQKREDPVFETYKKVKATEESLNEEFRSGFIILTCPVTS